MTGKIGLATERTSGGFRLSFADLAEFHLFDECRRIDVRAQAGVPATTVRHLLIDHAVPWALGAQGELILHASGVAFPQGAVLFLGPSGAGKSTIAARLVARGRSVVSDDGARLVEDGLRFAVAPSYPGLRLWPDGVDAVLGAGRLLPEVAHNSTKRRWVPETMEARAIPLACLFILDDSVEAVEIAPLSRREALVSALDQCFKLPGGKADEVERHFDRMAAVVSSSPAFLLRYPYDFSKLNAVADLVEATLFGAPGATISGLQGR